MLRELLEKKDQAWSFFFFFLSESGREASETIQCWPLGLGPSWNRVGVRDDPDTGAESEAWLEYGSDQVYACGKAKQPNFLGINLFLLSCISFLGLPLQRTTNMVAYYNRNLFFHSSSVQKSEINASSGLVPFEALWQNLSYASSSFWKQLAFFCIAWLVGVSLQSLPLSSHGAFSLYLCISVSKFPASYKDSIHIFRTHDLIQHDLILT